ncbi:uncharacterized protein BYT42DRAFT_572537 [Radiomyces spectabilis]|uniref:uncharacterized protein n=1 Tax=Radiomyces spectabilis TaxID=64574 RepID=UPI00221EDE0A|nr:uncharacterized protein BYT42DRAFT_572537 [Radiomyces spectabilis]KAI8378048.1 hypothetical protein BYT42DRAFT_572537 [Radiomyces spectabilis]
MSDEADGFHRKASLTDSQCSVASEKKRFSRLTHYFSFIGKMKRSKSKQPLVPSTAPLTTQVPPQPSITGTTQRRHSGITQWTSASEPSSLPGRARPFTYCVHRSKLTQGAKKSKQDDEEEEVEEEQDAIVEHDLSNDHEHRVATATPAVVPVKISSSLSPPPRRAKPKKSLEGWDDMSNPRITNQPPLALRLSLDIEQTYGLARNPSSSFSIAGHIKGDGESDDQVSIHTTATARPVLVAAGLSSISESFRNGTSDHLKANQSAAGSPDSSTTTTTTTISAAGATPIITTTTTTTIPSSPTGSRPMSLIERRRRRSPHIPDDDALLLALRTAFSSSSMIPPNDTNNYHHPHETAPNPVPYAVQVQETTTFSSTYQSRQEAMKALEGQSNPPRSRTMTPIASVQELDQQLGLDIVGEEKAHYDAVVARTMMGRRSCSQLEEPRHRVRGDGSDPTMLSSPFHSLKTRTPSLVNFPSSPSSLVSHFDHDDPPVQPMMNTLHSHPFS